MSEYNIQMNKYNALNAEYDQLYPVTKIKNVDGLNIALQKKVNPNLLDNWYFGNPVDQRGQTSYTGVGYTVDRWKSYTNLTTIIEPDGITIRNDTANTGYFGQIEESDLWDALVGKTVTMSVLTGNGTLYFSTGKYGTNISFPVGDGVNAYMWPTSKEPFDFSIAAGVSIKVSAVKLELGDQQTLAHQDADGNWVLNEIPDYGEQLRKCQRYQNVEKGAVHSVYGRTEGGGTSLSLTLPLPVTPRANGNITIPSMTVAGNGGVVTVSGVNTTAIAKQNGIYFAVSGNFASIGISEVVNCYLGEGYIADFNL